MASTPAYATGCSAVASTTTATSITSTRHFQHYVHPRQEVVLRSEQRRYPTVNIFNHNRSNNNNNMMRRDTHSCDDLVRFFDLVLTCVNAVDKSCRMVIHILAHAPTSLSHLTINNTTLDKVIQTTKFA